MIKTVVELSDSKLRDLVADYIYQAHGLAPEENEIRFHTIQGYNGEMGGEPYPTRVSVYCEIVE